MLTRNVVILTGAGISSESGIPTFRADDGLWENHRIEAVATLEGFRNNSKLVYEFYNQRRERIQAADIQPNSAHMALAELERCCFGEFTLITQNVDNLHERAGSQNVVHMHGELLSALCMETGERFEWLDDLTEESIQPSTGMKGTLRPDIVWFGEQPYQMGRIYDALRYCRLFIAIGTSGHVYPAAGFIQEVMMNCARTIEVNLEETEISPFFHEHYYGLASEKVPEIIKQLLIK
jgi:NAD-dependent deacetylase